MTVVALGSLVIGIPSFNLSSNLNSAGFVLSSRCSAIYSCDARLVDTRITAVRRKLNWRKSEQIHLSVTQILFSLLL